MFKYIMFQSLLFYSELNEVRGSYVWILKWVNLQADYSLIQKYVKHLRWSVLRKIVNSF